MKILMVLTSHDQLGNTGKKTGFWLEELAAPYYVLKDAGAAITLASPKGGRPPLDPKSDLPENQTESTRRFRADKAAQAELANTKKLADVSADDFDAIFYPGGHGPMWDMPDNATSIALIEAFVKADKPVGAVCHAPAALDQCTRKGRQVSDPRQACDRVLECGRKYCGPDRVRSVPAGRPAKGTRRRLQQGCQLGSLRPGGRQACNRSKPGLIGTRSQSAVKLHGSV